MLLCQLANNLYAIMFENFFLMRSVGDFAGEILTGEMQKLMHPSPPFRTIGYVVNNSIVRDPHGCAAFACIAA